MESTVNQWEWAGPQGFYVKVATSKIPKLAERKNYF